MSLKEYLVAVLEQEGETKDRGGAAALLVLDLLRIPNVEGPTRRELAQDAEIRLAWVQGAKLLEHERAVRLAFAITNPGVRLEAALQQDDSVEDAISSALARTDELLHQLRGSQ